MKWVKRDVIFTANAQFDWMRTHTSIPVVDRLSAGVLRVYFGTRDAHGISRIGSVDLDASDPARILGISNEPVLSLGRPGTFDDSGMAPSWITHDGERRLLYYIGWNRQVSVPYRLSIGLAISESAGSPFRKYSEGPICDRSIEEPYFNTAPCVLRDDALWRMWYVSCTGWHTEYDPAEPSYHIKYAESDDGMHWRRPGVVCIDYQYPAHAIGRPCVFKEHGRYHMLYSHRSIDGYRTDPTRAYRFGFAESHDGVAWTTHDGDAGLSRSESGWDSEMIEYCFVLNLEGTLYLFYNGNGFGRSGFGYACREP
jgi:predicted GH43/DUF377 family glycosyl hydrolase